MALRFSEICVDAADIHALGQWWSQVLGWPAEDTEDGDVLLRAPGGAGPDWLFVPVPEGKVVKNRIHFDFTPDDQQAEIDRLIGAGRPARGHRPGRAVLGGAGRPRRQRILCAGCRIGAHSPLEDSNVTAPIQ